MNNHIYEHKVFNIFKTLIIKKNNDKTVVVTCRRNRKNLSELSLLSTVDSHEKIYLQTQHIWRPCFYPKNISWWLAIFFIIGSFLFSFASFFTIYKFSFSILFAPYLGQIFFIGSIFFTSAAYLQYLESINNNINESKSNKFILWGWYPNCIAFNISITQLIGTILFNLNTWDCMLQLDSNLNKNIFIWLPDFLGSILFLVSGTLALIEVTHGKIKMDYRNLSWWIVIINFLGCAFFQISASSSLYLPEYLIHNQDFTSNIANFTLLLGSLSFLTATYLLLPELRETKAEIIVAD